MSGGEYSELFIKSETFERKYPNFINNNKNLTESENFFDIASNYHEKYSNNNITSTKMVGGFKSDSSLFTECGNY